MINLTQQLIDSAGDDDIKQVKIALEAGVDVDSRNDVSWTALMRASWNGCDDAVRLLLEHGADVNLKSWLGDTALMWAAFSGYTDTVRLLLESGADVEIINDKGKSALNYAEDNKHVDVVELLKRYIGSRHEHQSLTVLIDIQTQDQKFVDF